VAELTLLEESTIDAKVFLRQLGLAGAFAPTVHPDYDDSPECEKTNQSQGWPY
jgi:hypothetical protein